MPGPVEIIRYLYQLDLADHATKGMLAAHRAEQKATTQTNQLLARQDTARRRSSTVATSAAAQATRMSARNAQALDRETAAVRRNTAAQERATAARRRASDPSIVRRTAGNIGSTARGAVGGVAAIASIASAKQAVSVTMDLGKATIALNKNTGMSIAQSSRWAAVARSRNIESKALNQSFVTLSKAIGKAGSEDSKYQAKLKALGNSEKDRAKRQELIAKGAGDTTAAFQKLGISQDELAKSDFDTILKKAADGLAAMGDNPERAVLAAKLLGRGWQTVSPILRGGSRAMEEQLRLADKYGVTLNGKTVKSIADLAAAQREAKFAAMGLEVAFSTKVVPTLTKVINKGSEFAAQMRTGEGAGGRFAKRAREIADDLRPVADGLQSVGGFLVDHPHLVVAAAGAYVAFKAARGTTKIVNDLRDMKTAVVAVSRAAAKSRIAALVADGASGATGLVRRALGGMRDTVTNIMRRAGRDGGAAAAESIARNAGTNLGPELDRNQKRFTGGRWSKIGRLAGRAFGVAAVGAILYELRDPLSKALDDLFGTKSDSLRSKLGFGNGGSKFGVIGDLLGKIPIPGNRRGGVVEAARRFQGGGLVPIAAAGGELLVDRGRATMIPGRDDRDGTLTWARPGAAVMTYDGQARMAAGASLAEAVRSQAPHFAKGGVVPGKYTATSYGPPWGGIQGTGITRTGVNLKRNPHLYGIATDPRMIALGSKVFAQPNPFGYTGRFTAFDTGGAIKGRRIDFYDWRGRARQNGWGRRTVTISRARLAARQDGDDVYRAPGGGGTETTVRMLGRDRRRAGLLGDAFAQGRTAGQSGLTLSEIKRSGSPVTRAVIEALRAAGETSTAATAARKATPAKGSSSFHAGGGWGGTEAIVRTAIRGLGHATFKRPANHRLSISNPGSDHNMANKNAFAADLPPGDRIFNTLRRRLGLPAQKGSWNKFANKPIRGFRTQLLWHAPDGSHRDHNHLGVRRMRSGGIVGAGRRLTSGLRRTMSFSGGTFEALDEIIQRAAETRLSALRQQVATRVQRGGSKQIVDRLRGVLDLVDSELGRRVGRIEDVVDRRTTRMERGRGATERMLRARGIAGDSLQGLAASQVQQAAEIQVRGQNVTSLQKALRTATRARNQEAIRDLTGKLHDAQDELAESLVRQVELARDRIRALGDEAVGASQFRLSLAQTGAAGLEALQRLNRTQDTPEGIRQRAGALQGGVVPALQAAAQAHQLNAQLLASIGDVAGWRSAVQDAASAAVDLANAQADAADLMREAAARAAQDAVDAASHGRTMSDLSLQRLELEQQLVGTFDSSGGRRGRADFIRQQILPAIQAELEALAAQQAAAQQGGDPVLARQIAEAIAGKKNEQLQAQLNALEAIKENTDPLKEFGGSSAFSLRDQVWRDNDVDVIAARLGA